MILNDSTLSATPRTIIETEKCNAEWALKVQTDELLQQFDAIEDGYLRERKADVMQVAERVMKALSGQPGYTPPPAGDFDRNLMLVAHDLSPADVMLFKQHQFASFITDLGGATSHTAIVARSLNIPCIVALHHARAADPRKRDAHRGRHAGRGHRRPRQAGAGRIQAAPEPVGTRAAEAQAPARHAGAHAGRHRSRTARQYRVAAGRRDWQGKAAPPASACSAANSCSSTATTCRTRRNSSRPTARWRGNGRACRSPSAPTTSVRTSSSTARARLAPTPRWGCARSACA